MTDYVKEAKDMVANNRLFQFSASWCPDCVYARSIWNKYHVENQIHVFDIGSLDKEIQAKWRDAFEEVLGGRNLPTIVVDGKVWGTETRLHEVEDNGSLSDELTKMGFKL